MKIERKKYRLTGVAPLMLHNTFYLADPRSPICEAMKPYIAKKSKATEDDAQIISQLEWLGGWYLKDLPDFAIDGDRLLIDADGADWNPIIPDHVINALVWDCAAQERLRPKAKAGVMAATNATIEFDYPGSLSLMLDAGRKYLDRRLVTLGSGKSKRKIMRTRPIIPEWKLTIELDVFTSVFDSSCLPRILQGGGLTIGIGDYRPVYGRFDVQEVA